MHPDQDNVAVTGADLVLSQVQQSFRLIPGTVHGMLWIQTHFESSTWDLVCSGDVRISRDSSQALRDDAIAAGLQVQLIPASPLFHRSA